MDQLRLTTSKPGFMGTSNSPLVTPDNITTITELTDRKCSSVYIHGKAESLAGYDIPIFIDGDMNNFNLPVDQQNILLILPSGEYKCKCTIEQDLIDKQYYITLFDEPIGASDRWTQFEYFHFNQNNRI